MWAARLFKTRALAAEQAELGRVSVNGIPAKPSRELKAGDLLAWRQDDALREVEVLGLSKTRGPAPVAQTLYRETADSLSRRAAAVEARRQGVEPARTLPEGRPTKRDRRKLAQWSRWSASADDDP